MIVNVFVLTTAILKIISKFVSSYETLMIGRIIGGIYSGLFTGITPLYLEEISPKNLRGITGTINHLFIVIGVLMANVLGLDFMLGTKHLWPVLVGFILVPFSVHLLLIWAVESPKYLLINRFDKEAAKEGNKNFEMLLHVNVLYHY